MFEPIHGSAPDIAGKNMANPIGMIASAAMMLSYSFDLPKEAEVIEQAIQHTLDEGYRTKDIEGEWYDIDRNERNGGEDSRHYPGVIICQRTFSRDISPP